MNRVHHIFVSVVFALLSVTQAYANEEAGKSPAHVKQCESEFEAISNYPSNLYELALIGTQSELLKWFVEYNEQPGLSPQDQLWSYKTYASSTYLLGQNAGRSARIQKLILGFSSNTVAFLSKEKSFDEYYETGKDLGKRIDEVRVALAKTKPALTKTVISDVNHLADCVRAVGMMSAVSKSQSSQK